ncbi:M56 family metallopeptidase [Blautia marasmi]|uniref:M56 family metallopeptidase n=1 Tax=Blautia marasmi TaxID=1917868 RepID=UPI00266C9995|nr:M56 family metallopeptidase [Blautia marasmi]
MHIGIMGTQASLLVLTAVFLRMLLLYRVPKRTFVFLWWAAAFRLLIPFSVETRWNIYSLWQRTGRSIRSNEILSGHGIVAGEGTGVVQMGHDVLQAAAAGKAGGASVGFCVWIAGAVAMACFFLLAHIRFVLHAKTSLPTGNKEVQSWQKKHICRRQVRIRTLDTISSPMTYGILHPVILLPSRFHFLDSEALVYVLEHEWIHIRRMDVGLKYLLAAALCVHWINPVVWILFFLAQRDMELACDEKVVKTVWPNQREKYAMLLLGLEERREWGKISGVRFSEKWMAGRLRAVMKVRKWTAGSAFAAALLIGVPVVLFFTGTGIKAESLEVLQKVEDKFTLGEQAAVYARSLVGKPYMYNGKNLLGGTDCTGFVKAVYQEFGISLPDHMKDMARQGQEADGETPGPGSIVFYGKDQMPEHVAISLGDGKVVHASNAREGVKISPLRYREICKVIDIPYQIR